MCDWAYAYRIDRQHPPTQLPRGVEERLEIVQELVNVYGWNVWDAADSCGVAPRNVRRLAVAS